MSLIGHMTRGAADMINRHIRRHGFWGSLIRTNTGVSSLNFYVIGTTIIGISLLATIQFSIVWEVIHNGLVSSDLSGWAALVGAITTLFASAGVAKSWSNWSEHKYTGKEASGEEAEAEIVEDDIPVETPFEEEVDMDAVKPKARKKATSPRKPAARKRTTKKKA